MAMYEYQKESVEFLKRHKRVIIGHDTGLGKTRICVEAVLELIPVVRRVLVICPAFLVANWEREIAKWGAADKANWIICSYHATQNEEYVQMLLKFKPHLMICDEAHYLKNWTAIRTRTILLKLSTRIPRLWLLTATPLTRAASDLHPLFSAVEPKVWGNYGEFCEKYCNKVPDQWNSRGWKYSGVKNAEELQAIKGRALISVSKAESLPELPEKMVTDVPLRIAQAMLGEDKRAELEQEVGKKGFPQSESLAAERQRVGLIKVDFVADWARNVGEPVVIFGWHTGVLQDLSAELGIMDCGVITGQTPMAQRTLIIDRFQEGKIPYLLASIGSCGVGINLHHARVAAFIELPWSAAELKQCEDRLHRIGQKNAVNIYRFICEGSIDEIVMRVIEGKVEATKKTVGHT